MSFIEGVRPCLLFLFVEGGACIARGILSKVGKRVVQLQHLRAPPSKSYPEEGFVNAELSDRSKVAVIVRPAFVVLEAALLTSR